MSGFFFWGMMDDPVVYLSSISMKPNSWDDQSTSSSQRLDRWTAVWAAQYASSVTKSLSLTESMEFSVGSLNASASAVMRLSMGYVVPASAAAPRGHLSILLNASRNLSASRENLKAWASMCWARVTGWACCMWVNPGITASPLSSATLTRAIMSPLTASAALRASSLRYILKSVATWSFLLLPVCSLPPAGPIAWVRLNSMQVWTSSRE